MKSDKKTKTAPALSRGLKLMEFLAGSAEPQSLTAIASQMDIAMSTAFTLCATLVDAGYVEKHGVSYQLTLKVLDLASSKIRHSEIVDLFNEACEDIDLIKKNGATLTMLDGPDVFFIAVRNSPQPLGVTFRPGTRLPACCMASGRALLSSLTNEEVCELYPNEEIPQMTKANPRFRSELLEILAETRASGHSREIKGTRPHMYSYGALVSSPNGRAVAGVALSLHEEDMTPEVEIEAVEAIQSLGARLSQFSSVLG
ncbi:IclR family transcriptional regulator [uncultured Ruegeria sp.]|uniref:IclR family transcriptional regulator n=1 Tax=uncultured Ruegeria sp. TaxID=259304 RepID=UPI002627D18B|nr:IclR family transcriptional regulator [uncultured Ruegeria sp.]